MYVDLPGLLSPQEEEKLVRDVMRHMVFRNQVKPDVPVPRADLAKLFPAQVQLQLHSNHTCAAPGQADASE